jgi:hypothetical protein
MIDTVIHDHFESTAVRCGKFKAMLMWMAKEGRLKPFELELLCEELGRNVFKSDLQDLTEVEIKQVVKKETFIKDFITA